MCVHVCMCVCMYVYPCAPVCRVLGRKQGSLDARADLRLSWRVTAKTNIKKEISSPGNMWEARRKNMEKLFQETGEAVRAARKDYGTSSERNQLGEASQRELLLPPPSRDPPRGTD